MDVFARSATWMCRQAAAAAAVRGPDKDTDHPGPRRASTQAGSFERRTRLRLKGPQSKPGQRLCP
jgi:hypothetical protein